LETKAKSSIQLRVEERSSRLRLET